MRERCRGRFDLSDGCRVGAKKTVLRVLLTLDQKARGIECSAIGQSQET